MFFASTKTSADDQLGRAKSFFDDKEGVVYCREPLPEFTLGYNSNPSDQEVESLCSCIWSKFPEDRWERKEAKRIFKGAEMSLRTIKLIKRFKKSMKVCGGFEL